MPAGRPMTVVFSDMQIGDAAHDERGAERDDEGRHLELGDDDAVDEADDAAPATPAANPMTTEGKSGTPALKAPRIASAERTEARLITQPTDRSMPAAMMTKV